MKLPKFASKSYQHMRGHMLILDICKGICIFVNKDFKEVYIAIHDNKAVYANTNAKWFIEGMKALEPNIFSRQTLINKLKEDGVAYFTGRLGTHYKIYRYQNANYRGLTRVHKKKEN